MKRISTSWILPLGLYLMLTGCSDDKNSVQQFGNTLVQPLKTTKNVEKQVNVLEMQKSIQEYYAANGRYPADLNEVAAFNGMTLESDKYDYNPTTGSLTQKP